MNKKYKKLVRLASTGDYTPTMLTPYFTAPKIRALRARFEATRPGGGTMFSGGAFMRAIESAFPNHDLESVGAYKWALLPKS